MWNHSFAFHEHNDFPSEIISPHCKIVSAFGVATLYNHSVPSVDVSIGENFWLLFYSKQ